MFESFKVDFSKDTDGDGKITAASIYSSRTHITGPRHVGGGVLISCADYFFFFRLLSGTRVPSSYWMTVLSSCC